MWHICAHESAIHRRVTKNIILHTVLGFQATWIFAKPLSSYPMCDIKDSTSHQTWAQWYSNITTNTYVRSSKHTDCATWIEYDKAFAFISSLGVPRLELWFAAQRSYGFLRHWRVFAPLLSIDRCPEIWSKGEDDDESLLPPLTEHWAYSSRFIVNIVSCVWIQPASTPADIMYHPQVCIFRTFWLFSFPLLLPTFSMEMSASRGRPDKWWCLSGSEARHIPNANNGSLILFPRKNYIMQDDGLKRVNGQKISFLLSHPLLVCVVVLCYYGSSPVGHCQGCEPRCISSNWIAATSFAFTEFPKFKLRRWSARYISSNHSWIQSPWQAAPFLMIMRITLAFLEYDNSKQIAEPIYNRIKTWWQTLQP